MMRRQLAIAAVLIVGWANFGAAQEAIPQPAWVPHDTYNLVHSKHFGAEDVANMLVELPNRPRRAGQKGSLGPEFMFPYRPQYAEQPTSGPAGPEQYLSTPFGPVSSRLQRPQLPGARRAAAKPSRRKPLNW